MDRRTFTKGILVSPVALTAARGQSTSKLRVAVIGHTGRGNYGHGLDKVWLQVPQTEIVAVADGDAKGLAEAKRRLGAEIASSDYRNLLTQVKPDLVAVCPRHPDQHRDMTVAAIEAGARGVYVEKPFCRTPAEADDIVAACDKHGAKVAIAHRNRYHPVLQTIDKMIEDGAIGELLEIRGRGKGDRRGGSEDLWVLGSHVLNLLQYFGGRPRSCSAMMKLDGRPVGPVRRSSGQRGIGATGGERGTCAL